MGAIAGTSFTAHYKMNGATEQTAQGWAEGVFGRSTSAAKRAAPYFYKAAKSRTLKAAALAFIPAGGIFAYEWVDECQIALAQWLTRLRRVLWAEATCQSAWGPDADRRAKPLICFTVVRSLLDAYFQSAVNECGRTCAQAATCFGQ